MLNSTFDSKSLQKMSVIQDAKIKSRTFNVSQLISFDPSDDAL